MLEFKTIYNIITEVQTYFFAGGKVFKNKIKKNVTLMAT